MALLNDAGKLRHRCTFMTMKEERTSRGTVREIPVELFTCWCAFTRHSIRDVKEAVGTGHDIRKTIIIRHRQRHDIDNTMKVKIKDNIYDIHQYIPDDDRQEFDMITLADKK